MQRIKAADFKARCLALLDQVARTGEELMITKHGRPVAQIVPVQSRRSSRPFAELEGTVEILGDLIRPALSADRWDAERGEWEPGPLPKRKRPRAQARS